MSVIKYPGARALNPIRFSGCNACSICSPACHGVMADDELDSPRT